MCLFMDNIFDISFFIFWFFDFDSKIFFPFLGVNDDWTSMKGVLLEALGIHFNWTAKGGHSAFGKILCHVNKKEKVMFEYNVVAAVACENIVVQVIDTRWANKLG